MSYLAKANEHHHPISKGDELPMTRTEGIVDSRTMSPICRVRHSTRIILIFAITLVSREDL